MRNFVAIALTLVVAQSLPAAADEAANDKAAETTPYIEGAVEVTLGNNTTFQSDEPGREINDLYAESELALRFGLTSFLAVNAGLTLEAVRAPFPPRDTYFAHLGLYVDTLNIELKGGGFSFAAGKFGPAFGHAWDNTPGIFGTDFAEDYELAEQIGFGASYAFDMGAAGTHTLGANVFFADTTGLSDSIFTRRGRLSVARGGAGNTGRLDNFSIVLDGGQFPSLPGFSYHLGYRHLSAGLGSLGDENGFVASVAGGTKLPSGVILAFTGEVAYFSNFGGTLDAATYITPGLSIGRGPWHGDVSGTIRKMDFNGGGSQTDLMAQISGGYTFESGIDFSVGYTFTQAGGIEDHVIGLTLTKEFKFSTR